MGAQVSNTADRSVEISRKINAPRELVWKAMTEPEHQNKWWGPDGFRNVEVTMDFRVGGAGRHPLSKPHGVQRNHTSVPVGVRPW